MAEPYYHPDRVHYRNLSKRQREILIRERLAVPGYLMKLLNTNSTQMIRDFNQAVNKMIHGKITFNTDALKNMLDQIDAARYATPPVEKTS